VAAIDPESSIYAFPSDLEVTASAAQTAYRALATRHCTVYIFMATVVFLLAYGITILVNVYMQQAVVPSTSAFAEGDINSKSGHPSASSEVDVNSNSSYPSGPLNQNVSDLSSALRNEGPPNAKNGKIVEAIKDKRVRIVRIQGDEEQNEGQHVKGILLLASSDCVDIPDFQSLSAGVPY
jgi:hypothetical protein